MLRVSRESAISVPLRGLCRAAASTIVLAATLGMSALAGAETPEGLAPPGPCAEPREAVVGAPPPSASSMVGPLSSFFSPSAVAAAATAAPRPPPSAARSIRPGACDNPGAGCAARSPAVPVVRPGDRPGAR